MQKTVTNLLTKISKARDILATGDKNEIYKHLYLFLNIENDVKIQVSKYIKHASHELDFNYHDLQELSDEIYSFIQNYQQKFLFTKYYKQVEKLAPIDDKVLKSLNQEIGKEMTLDTELRSVYKTLAYLALIIFLWSETDEKKPFDVQITELIRSFI